ncbi:MAG: hypothetical protein ABIQ85_05115 [Cypionkella sp.]
MVVQKKRIAQFLALFFTAFATSGCVIEEEKPVVHVVKPLVAKPLAVKRVAKKAPATVQPQMSAKGY